MSATRDSRQGVQVTWVTGTPSSFPAATDETLDGLEFADALEVVARHAVGELGAAQVRARVPHADPTWVRAELALVTQLQDLLLHDEPFRPVRVDDIRGLLARLEVAGAALDGPALVLLARAMEAMHEVGTALRNLAERAPLLAALAVPLPARTLSREITRTLDDDGRVRDGADSAVDRTRRQIQRTRERLLRTLERTLASMGVHATPNAAVTIRAGRYVIPVAREARNRVPGIVHEESASGATLFVEPQSAVELGNALGIAQAAEARAVQVVLRRLSDGARPQVDAIRNGWLMCVAVDDLYARARYAVVAGGAAPQVTMSPGEYRLRGARHPLLLAEGIDAVPFDLELGEDELAVVVSGPNTGGKTVMLKTVGLASALTQAGVIPPIGAGSTLPIFRRILADIGDHQSIAANLSTFSAHVAALKAALDVADPETLALFDELGSGTDPAEGAALAAAAVQTLVERGTRMIGTTHLSALKELATEMPGVVNASLHFDDESLAPTYRLAKGAPGRSYGLVIARRLGIRLGVLERAEARLAREERALDALLAEAEHRSQQIAEREASLDLAAARLRNAETDAERQLAEADERERELARREREAEREGRERARRFLLDARKRVDEALGLARAAVSEATAKEARRLVEQGISAEAEELERIERELAAKGWRVKRGDTERGRAGEKTTNETVVREGPARQSPLPEIEASSEIDLRGMAADEARAAVLRAVDGAVLADLPSLRIIHGKGTGRLRAAVRDVLAQDRRVAAVRMAPTYEGGGGVTIAELA